MLELIRKSIRLLSKYITLRNFLRVIAVKLIRHHNSLLNYVGWGMANNISLSDINSFTVIAPNSEEIVYGLCPQDNWVLKKMFWSRKHLFEKDTAALFFKKAVNARTVLDIGANIGYYTYLAAAANKSSNVMAFEPIDYLAEIIRDNSRINGFKNVLVFSRAVSNKKGSFPFYININSPTMSAFTLDKGVDLNKYRKVMVESVCLDDFIVDNNIINIDLIKIDAEEHEAEVLEGMETVIKRDKPDIICEILPVVDKKKAEKRDKMQNIFKRHNYKCYWISPMGLIEENQITGHQVFNANYLFTARD